MSVVLFGKISRHRDGVAAGVRNRLHGPANAARQQAMVALVDRPRRYRDARAITGETFGDCLADPPAGATITTLSFSSPLIVGTPLRFARFFAAI